RTIVDFLGSAPTDFFNIGYKTWHENLTSQETSAFRLAGTPQRSREAVREVGFGVVERRCPCAGNRQADRIRRRRGTAWGCALRRARAPSCRSALAAMTSVRCTNSRKRTAPGTAL